jgi:hypothetical protein
MGCGVLTILLTVRQQGGRYAGSGAEIFKGKEVDSGRQIPKERLFWNVPNPGAEKAAEDGRRVGAETSQINLNQCPKNSSSQSRS